MQLATTVTKKEQAYTNYVVEGYLAVHKNALPVNAHSIGMH